MELFSPMEAKDYIDSLGEDLCDAARYGDLQDVKDIIQDTQDTRDRAPNIDLRSRILQFKKEPSKNTALHFAAANGHLDVVQLLIRNGADIDAQNENGNTPLHWASLNGNESILRFLLENGAKMAVLNAVQRTALDDAKSEDIRRFLITFAEKNPKECEEKDDEREEEVENCQVFYDNDDVDDVRDKDDVNHCQDGQQQNSQTVVSVPRDDKPTKDEDVISSVLKQSDIS